MDWENLPSLNTERLLLRALTIDDVDDVYAVFSDHEVMRYWSTPALANKEAAAALIEEIQTGFAQQQSLKWGVALLSDSRVIGTATLFRPDFTHRRAELGYALGRKHWGQGYMHERSQRLLLTPSTHFIFTGLRRTSIHETRLPLERLSASAFSVKATYASAGTLAEKRKTRCSMVC
ncbi:MAG TPA: GNAT family N-acetyltransferase [Pyrinomonadaceae bacterium]|nr:GNAT family N-acetyltransferase [Pyrinomonadaceae bacterium]